MSEVSFVSALSKTERLDNKFESQKINWVENKTAGVGNAQTLLESVQVINPSRKNPHHKNKKRLFEVIKSSLFSKKVDPQFKDSISL